MLDMWSNTEVFCGWTPSEISAGCYKIIKSKQKYVRIPNQKVSKQLGNRSERENSMEVELDTTGSRQELSPQENGG